MSPIVLVLAGFAVAALSFFLGSYAGGLSARRRLNEAASQYEALKRDFETISAVNLQLLRAHVPSATSDDGEDALQRFLVLYDDAKRCLHRTLDRHNATAPRPIVITRDGANILEALDQLPERSFSTERGEDAGVRSWLRRVFEQDLERRRFRAAPQPDRVLALEGERAIWAATLKQAARV